MTKALVRLVLSAFGLAVYSSVSSAALPSAQQVASKWKTRTQGAQQDYADGVANTDKDPTQLAIAAGQRLLDNFTKAFNSGKWANGLRKTGKQGWQQAVASKGVTNFANGVAAAEDKVATAFAPLLAFEANLQTQVRGMPNVTDNDREQRMLAWVRGMRKYSGS